MTFLPYSVSDDHVLKPVFLSFTGRSFHRIKIRISSVISLWNQHRNTLMEGQSQSQRRSILPISQMNLETYGFRRFDPIRRMRPGDHNFSRRCMCLSTSIPDDEKPQIVFVLGGPGAGKGTHCSQIVSSFGFKHLSAGDLLREERIKTESEFGEVIEKHIRQGTIVPASITCSLIEKAILRSKGCKFFLVDGFPRNQDNLARWEKQMDGKVNVLFVLFFDVPEEISIKRCLSRGEKGSGRSDDNIQVITKRLATYQKDTLPIIQYYAKRNLVYSIDSSKSVDEVFGEVSKCFEKALKCTKNTKKL